MTASYSIRLPNYIGGHRELLSALGQDPALADSRRNRTAVEFEPDHAPRRNPNGLGTSGVVSGRSGPEPLASFDAVVHVVQQAHEVVVAHLHVQGCLPVDHHQSCHLSPFSCAGSLGLRES